MKKTILPYSKVPQLSKTDTAYASGDPLLQPFYQYEPNLASIAPAVAHRRQFTIDRSVLVQVLKEQYAGLTPQPQVEANLAALAHADTFTVTTAHQPSLFLGPLYFIYKALSTIKLAEAASLQTGHHVVPVFVLGSEDHDLDELNHAQLFGKKLTWMPGQGGPVGNIPAETLQPVLLELKNLLGSSEDAQALFQRVEAAYAPHRDFAGATQALLHEFFAPYGLVVLNPNHLDLKRRFIPVMRAELLEQPAVQYVNETIRQLSEAGFKAQAAPREINLFYLAPGRRERIVRDGDVYRVLNTELAFNTEEMLLELEQHPENFSPNVVLRPLYQEMILPNLAYIGGGGELAYWLERKRLFEHFGVHFPILVRRHSVLWLDQDACKKLDKFGFAPETFFADTEWLVKDFIARNATVEVTLSHEMQQLKQIYQTLGQKAAAIDPTLGKAVAADSVKAQSSLEQWESRLVRAEKQKHEVTLNQLRALKAKLFPENGLQERTDNFLPYVLKYGENFIRSLSESFSPFDPGFLILQPAD